VTEEHPFEEIYDQHFDFVWRTARRLGAAGDAIDDVVQEVFLVVHRRMSEPRTCTLRAWIYGVTVHTVRNHRRSLRRKDAHAGHGPSVDPDAIANRHDDSPESSAERAEAARTIHRVLEELDEEKREVFVLVELEELTTSEVALVLDLNTNTVSSRLRLAREGFAEGVRRYRARDEWRLR